MRHGHEPAENTTRNRYPASTLPLWLDLRKHVTWFLSIVWHHCACTSFTDTRRTLLLYYWLRMCCGRCLAVDLEVTILFRKKCSIFNAQLLAKSQFASGRSCDRPILWSFSVVFLCLRANAELVHQVHFALHVLNAALQMTILKFRSCEALPTLM
jgi:hypothetical protein